MGKLEVNLWHHMEIIAPQKRQKVTYPTDKFYVLQLAALTARTIQARSFRVSGLTVSGFQVSGLSVLFPEGPTYTTIMELGPQNQNRDGFLGA